jgi:hypothetical protein
MDQNEFDIISIVATRKTEFYENAKRRLIASLPVSIDRDQAKSRLRRAISQLDNSLFISEDERNARIIDPALPVSELKLDKEEILAHMVRAMGTI